MSLTCCVMASFGFLYSILATSRLSSISLKKGKTKFDFATLNVCSYAQIIYWPDAMKKKKARSYKKLYENKYRFNESGVYFLSSSLSLIVTWNEKQFASGEDPSRHTGPINISSHTEYCISLGFGFFRTFKTRYAGTGLIWSSSSLYHGGSFWPLFLISDKWGFNESPCLKC